MLRNIGDERAAPVLREALKHPDTGVRLGALVSLGWSGDTADVRLVGALLRDEDPELRHEAQITVAELGGPEAVELLGAQLDHWTGRDLLTILHGLAWLGDERCIDPLLALAPESLGRDGGPQLAWSVVHVGTAAHARELGAMVVSVVRENVDHADSRGHARGVRAHDDLCVYTAIREKYPEVQEEVHRGLDDAGWSRFPTSPWADSRQTWQESEPVGARIVPRLHFVNFTDSPVRNGSDPPAKFGGLPDWRDEPTWPVSPDGQPLVFFGQLPLLEEPPRTAYIFFGGDRSWEPLGPASAVVVQPGPPPHLSTIAAREGPRLYDSVAVEPRRFRPRHRVLPLLRFVDLEVGADPERFEWPPESRPIYDRRDWNKIGGTPNWFQGPEQPPGDGWRFAFQFTAGYAAVELGDGAECYGFVHEDGRGAILWQCG